MSISKIVVIGGVACGPKAAARARRREPDADITIIERGDLLSYAGCGMPYYIQGAIETADELMSTAGGVVRDAAFFDSVKGIKVMGRTLAESIDRERQVVEMVSLETAEKSQVPYDKLVLAVGADAVLPPFPGANLKGVYRLNSPHDAEKIKDSMLNGCKRAVIIGAGLIGIEVTEAMATHQLSVTIIEMMDSVVPAVLDFETSSKLEKHLCDQGVCVMTGTKVKELHGDDTGQVNAVITDQGIVEADLVLIAVGVRPNIKLAVDAGLEIGETKAIKVNDYLQTSDPNIYAGGDCVENRHLMSGKPAYVPLGSTANKHGRIIGDNVTGGSSTFPGVMGTAVFKAFDFNVGHTGLSEKDCVRLGIPYVMALTPGPDRAHYYPTAQSMTLKMISSPEGKLLGVQAVGEGDVVKRIDVAATALSCGLAVSEISDLDLGYAPPFSSAVDLLSHAANVIDNKINGLGRAISPVEVKHMIDAEEDFILLDVRGQHEVEKTSLKNERVVNIPLGTLRKRVAELPKDKDIIAFCTVSLRGYEAQRILDGEGFDRVRFMDGGLVGWPYSLDQDWRET